MIVLLIVGLFASACIAALIHRSITTKRIKKRIKERLAQ